MVGGFQCEVIACGLLGRGLVGFVGEGVGGVGGADGTWVLRCGRGRGGSVLEGRLSLGSGCWRKGLGCGRVGGFFGGGGGVV